MTEFLDAVELQTGPQPTWSVLWLHGLGADGNDFAPIVPELVRPGWPALRFVFPHAPVRPVTINNGLRMRAWYDIAGMDFATRADAAGVAQSIDQVEALLAREGERGIAPANVLLAGFSQGGAITLAAGVRRRVPLAGLIALSTYLPGADQLPEFASDAAKAQPIFMGHGTSDPVVLPAFGQRSAQALTAAGFQVDWHDYPMPHSVSAEEIRDLGDWMSRRFG
ncbi:MULTISPECIES: alpha/beta hydrolase [Pseudoxanthomonas]|jgi:phospholipase/carboxylesterase|uniref:Alpha/beta hydrolase n=1 Tax=Pseudoxanthomonas winnipegensis TaxID=2480810 RepID=A0A4Q8LGI5_9GAMM|nr:MULTISPECIES: alpha/beta hydrolase [Pseudoxanthomonas]PZP64166.1 MAG: carboxylesterase [Pseudoxanthomonas spadix]TAA28582.1 alpha/beta hydrolase [Pseudoxanthomonas winnipegensis]TMN15610.1 alpha/beta hydrolase [Pseudoxanthomonas sp. X-1]UAY73971.1 alpha/beta hydrolase [Pseudoxanthomonas sp. X-1]